MTALQIISDTAQQVADAISAALGVETEIVDRQFNIVAGTGKYRHLVGSKDYEAAYPDSPFLYGRVLRTGESFIIEDTQKNELYGPYTMGEMGEICCPIILEDSIIGVIALVAFSQEQKENMLKKRNVLQHFLQHMAFLLANTVAAKEAFIKLNINTNLFKTMIEAFTSGVISFNAGGRVTHFNSKAEEIIGIEPDLLQNMDIHQFWPNSPVIKVLETGIGYNNNEEFYPESKENLHLLVSARPIIIEKKPAGAVVMFSKMAEARRLAYRLTDTQHELHFSHIKGESRQIKNLKEKALQVARSSSSILITGESGTGKELFARAIHFASPRRDKPLVIVNCGAIPETLLESELFGYEEGAFTGARKGGRPGKFELADGGTIFLDEIGDLPLHLQVKLLHVLQRRQVERVGGSKNIDVDVRIIAATNRNLEEMCASGEFREDLYYRLNVIPLVIPPLRERREDIPELMDHFLNKYNTLLQKQIVDYKEETVRVFMAYPWPGNVRELENSIEYAVNMENEPLIGMESLPARIVGDNSGARQKTNYNLAAITGEAEKKIIRELLEKVSAGMVDPQSLPDLLGVSRATFYRKLKAYGLAMPKG